MNMPVAIIPHTIATTATRPKIAPRIIAVLPLIGGRYSSMREVYLFIETSCNQGGFVWLDRQQLGRELPVRPHL
jgi:hypothetical protein